MNGAITGKEEFMLYRKLAGIAAITVLTLVAPLAASAAEEDKARKACKAKITDTYDLRKFRNAWVERLGHHKFQVHGEARFDHQWYDYQCKVKQGQVRSFAYHGPHNRHGNDSDTNTAVAVGVGLAIAAVVVSAADNDRHNDLSVPKTVLEDDCHDILQYRIRDEHDHTAAVKMRESRLKGRDLSGEAKVKYQHHSPHHVTYTCHFDGKGHITDSSYRLH